MTSAATIAGRIIAHAGDIDRAALAMAAALEAADCDLVELGEIDARAAAIARSRRSAAIIGAAHAAGLTGYLALPHQPAARKVRMLEHDRAVFAGMLEKMTTTDLKEAP